MTLQEKIQFAAKLVMKHPETKRETLDSLRVIIGEFQRQPKKILSDEEVVSILRKLVKNELEVLKHANARTSVYLETLNEFIPQQVGEEEIKAWIVNNVDFTNLKNRMQAVGLVMKHFGNRTDGNVVKKIVGEM